MADASRQLIVPARQIERLIHISRGQRVMLDWDLAKLYGVSTRRLNEQVRRNADRFPVDFAYQLNEQEFEGLMSQIAISKTGRGGRRKLPWVFTEQGVAMLSSVLRSPMAVRVNIEIMRAFVRLRRLLATPGEIVAQLTKLAETVELHDDQIRVIDEVLRKMMEPPPDSDKPKRRFGFHMPEPTNDQAHSGKGAFS
jgi:ORF6N domain